MMTFTEFQINDKRGNELKHRSRISNYDKYPVIPLNGFDKEIFTSYEEIGKELLSRKGNVYVVDCYPGVDEEEVLKNLEKELAPELVLHSDDIFYDGQTLTKMMMPHLTDDRVMGVMYYGKILDFVDEKALIEMQKRLEGAKDKRVLVYGFGASLISRGDILIYADLSRWEIQLRYRKGMPNFKQTNYDEDNLGKYKRGYFIEWRIADKHKRGLFSKADYWLDTNKSNAPAMITKGAFQEAMSQAVRRPFRTVPYFDPGVWGGQWMKEVCDLDRGKKNFAWSFDGVPEENSVLFGIGENIFECPAMNITLSHPLELLGDRVYARFGAEFPIRFDFLDTVEGENLSLQVHPTADFIKENYGMPFTQEESYYILDAGENAQIYLGVQNDVDINDMFSELKEAQRGEKSFPAEKYINIIDVKSHDHILIPPGTVHCSGSNCMVLEISSSAYIFTFKLWDWDRLGLDGLPRPIYLDEGRQVLNSRYNTDFVMNELVNQFKTVHREEGYLNEKTGLHPLEFIETLRHTFTKPVTLEIDNNVRMLNLVEGDEITIYSPCNEFQPYIVHYAETFIIPAGVSSITMAPSGKSKHKGVKVLEAYVR